MGLAPIVAVWVPNAIFAVIAIGLYAKRLRD
jgi:lipopolysaccharide export LptBFGC system permease protein LptF